MVGSVDVDYGVGVVGRRLGTTNNDLLTLWNYVLQRNLQRWEVVRDFSSHVGRSIRNLWKSVLQLLTMTDGVYDFSGRQQVPAATHVNYSFD